MTSSAAKDKTRPSDLSSINAIILSAGLGTRFRPQTNVLAKPAIPFLNIPLLYYAINTARSIEPVMNLNNIVINTHHLPETIDNIISEYSIFLNSSIPNIKTSFEKIVLGDAGGIKNNQLTLKENDFLVLNADTILIPEDKDSLLKAINYHKEQQALATFLVMDHTSFLPDGNNTYNSLWSDKDNNLRSIGPDNPVDSSTPSDASKLLGQHFYGVRIFSPKILDYIPCDGSSNHCQNDNSNQNRNESTKVNFATIFADTLPLAFKNEEKIKTYTVPAKLYDGGDLKTYLSDSADALKNLDDLPALKSMIEKTNPQTLTPTQLIGRNCKIHPSAKLTDSPNQFCILGNNVTIEENVTIKNSVIQSGVTISKNSIVDGNLVLV